MAVATGERKWNCELSSIDTALLLAGILTARQYFANDREVTTLADTIFKRIDFRWMLNGDRYLLAMGWYPEKGFIPQRWDHYCEHNILYMLAIASPTLAIPADSWYAWSRPPIVYEKYHYIYGDRPLFVYQYAHAWISDSAAYYGSRHDSSSAADAHSGIGTSCRRMNLPTPHALDLRHNM